MMRPARSPRWPQTALAFAALAAFGFAQAASDDAEVSVSAGLGGVSGDRSERSLFGQYNGLRTRSAVGLFGFEYGRRDDETGRAMRLEGTNLFGETRELDFRWKKPGDWKFSARYDEQVRYEPNEVSTGADLKVERTSLGIGMVKTISPRLQLEVDLRTEKKEGSRLFGLGMTCPSPVAPGCGGTTGIQTGWAVLLLPEPVDANHTQVQARVSYAQGNLRLSGGYYGSFYRNGIGSLNPNVPGSLNNAVGALQPLSPGLQDILNRPIALAPDNQVHQVDLAGSYALMPTSHLNFKFSYGQATQHQDFAGAGFTDGPANVRNLGGRVDTTRAQIGWSARPVQKLSLHAKVRYEDRDDRTPIAAYNVEGTATYTNRRLPLTKVRADVQAHYQFSSEYRGTIGADYESIDRGVFTATSAAAGISALRQDTTETGARAELRRRMSESVSGSIGLYSSRRTGSNWLRDNSGVGVTEIADPNDPAAGFSNAIFMPTLADRQRDKAKLTVDWQPSDALSLQLSAHSGRDSFTTPSAYGLRHSGMDQINLDANYQLSFSWSLNGFLSHGTETLRQARPAAAVLAYENKSTAAGFGFTGKPMSKLLVGGNVTLVNDHSRYQQTPDAMADGASVALLTASGGLPDIVFRQSLWKLYARYELDKKSDIRVDLVHQWSKWNDWAWGYNGVPFTYSDGTTVGQPTIQEVTFIGVSYIFRW